MALGVVVELVAAFVLRWMMVAELVWPRRWAVVM